ncbi:MAG TPA: DUF2877 domain-containing protein [bacterium]|nr:DUF2877 domain-containing protein [bacterium]
MGAVTPTLSALAVATPVRPFFETPGATGRVLAAFEQSAYIETEEGQLVALLAESLGRGAFALTVAGSPSFSALSPGDALLIEDHTLHLGELAVDLAAGAPWDPTIPQLHAAVEIGMRTLDAHLRTHVPEDGLSRAVFEATEPPESPLLTEGRGALALLRVAITQGDAAGVTRAVTRLAGLGPGLTPSGDDVLAGVLLTLHLWPESARPLGADIVAALMLGTAAPRTGRISRAYLWAARQGHASDAWHELVRALPEAGDGVAAGADRILQTGETSGADMLAGFLFGWRLRRDS